MSQPPRRPALWLLLVPAVLYCAAPLVANRIEPRVLGLPFLLAWIIAVTVLSPLVIWLVARFDPAYRADAEEPIPADDRPRGDAR
jgi:ABC-type iron transport system FetAB permease component